MYGLARIFFTNSKSGRWTLEEQKGLCLILFGSESRKLDVPFNPSLTLGDLADTFYADQLLAENNREGSNELRNYLSKFHIYTRTYGRNRETDSMNK